MVPVTSQQQQQDTHSAKRAREPNSVRHVVIVVVHCREGVGRDALLDPGDDRCEDVVFGVVGERGTVVGRLLD